MVGARPETKKMLRYLQQQEPGTFVLMKHVLSSACTNSTDDSTVIDSGANEGSWSLVAAAYGCRVIAVDPQPMCARLLQKAVAAPANVWLGGRLQVVNALLGTRRLNISFPVDGCHGVRQVLPNGKLSQAYHGFRLTRASNKRVRVGSMSVDELLPPGGRVAFWHLDVEGAELDVLASAATLFVQRRIERVMLEVIPSFW
eukprot:CAMPEP_0119306144 /NCGR_PEP_ID=MMETSP1333-20130426/6965_1 /TAXON_ID=418940 /ORGANISM="Scyphosphaera apsteinii, Strain RCC1455" /LENGTH=199 /DNA_ID=CAMNT_0007309377 /DNA_START=220 /DNA_END=816 /DNA_ORIENTATION=+